MVDVVAGDGDVVGRVVGAASGADVDAFAVGPVGESLFGVGALA